MIVTAVCKWPPERAPIIIRAHVPISHKGDYVYVPLHCASFMDRVFRREPRPLAVNLFVMRTYSFILPLFLGVYQPLHGSLYEGFVSGARPHKSVRLGSANSGRSCLDEPCHQPDLSWNRGQRCKTA